MFVKCHARRKASRVHQCQTRVSYTSSWRSISIEHEDEDERRTSESLCVYERTSAFQTFLFYIKQVHMEDVQNMNIIYFKTLSSASKTHVVTHLIHQKTSKQQHKTVLHCLEKLSAFSLSWKNSLPPPVARVSWVVAMLSLRHSQSFQTRFYFVAKAFSLVQNMLLWRSRGFK